MIEIWKDISNFEGIYQISNTGKVKSIERIVVCSDGQLKPVKERLISFGDNGHGNRSLNMKAAYKAGHRDNHKKIKYSNKPIFKYGK